MGQLVQVRQAGESRRSRAIALFEQGMTPLMVSKRLGLSRAAMVRMREEWVRETAPAADDFDPALAIGTYDFDRPMPKHCRFKSRRCEPTEGPTKKQAAADARKAVVESSALLVATDRALRERTPEAYAAVLGVMRKTR